MKSTTAADGRRGQAIALRRAGPWQFHTPTLKRHNPKTVRWNTGDEYHGCLRIDVQQSADLYRRIEGWARAALGAAEGGLTTQ